mmetsp:Transcript_2702/g.4586  ORF Transcript_2702/g.4586 Transcript_2702/m.4586 type:complete len:84 (+) Transcript_2702:677-928(+)
MPRRTLSTRGGRSASLPSLRWLSSHRKEEQKQAQRAGEQAGVARLAAVAVVEVAAVADNAVAVAKEKEKKAMAWVLTTVVREG